MQSKSSKWSSVSRDAMKQVEGEEFKRSAREMMNENRVERKKNAHSGNAISFGNDKVRKGTISFLVSSEIFLFSLFSQVVYESDTVEKQRDLLSRIDPAEYAENKKMIRNMRVALTRTNFSLGDGTESTMASHQSVLSTSTVSVDIKSKGVTLPSLTAKGSSISFGTQPPEYVSEMKRAMSTIPPNAQEFSDSRKEASKMKANLMRRTLTLGDDSAVDYTSDYQRGYGAALDPSFYHSDHRQATQGAAARQCQITLGEDKVEYVSDTRSAAERGAVRNVIDTLAQREGARAMKQHLMRTTLVIGEED